MRLKRRSTNATDVRRNTLKSVISQGIKEILMAHQSYFSVHFAIEISKRTPLWKGIKYSMEWKRTSNVNFAIIGERQNFIWDRTWKTNTQPTQKHNLHKNKHTTYQCNKTFKSEPSLRQHEKNISFRHCTSVSYVLFFDQEQGIAYRSPQQRAFGIEAT